MSTRPQIVCQYLEKMSHDILHKYPDLIRKYIHGRHGIYALYHHDRLYYVGLATNLRARLKQHLRDSHGGKWDRFSVYLTIESRQIKELESLVLRIVSPKGNKATGRFVKSENLSQKLKRDIRQSKQHETDELFGVRKTHRQAKPKVAVGKRIRLANLIGQALPLRAVFKKKQYHARVRKTDGRIRFDGRIYPSPSSAGKAVTGFPCDGWKFWKYERAPGDWIPINHLRK
ncbi:MAG: GIY-YIG nuclease family protein [Phycisphaeraceae bacterium]|nr:GIY-YIG nuclease family protein [Phycisphaeraceae bacterium]